MAAIAGPQHRVSAAVTRARAELDAVADASVWSMPAAEAGQTWVELIHLKAQIAELEGRVAAHASTVGVGDETAASSAAAWIAAHTQVTRGSAQAAVRLGKDLENHPRIREALAAGDLHADQARVIIRWVDQLPTSEVDALQRARAEAHLLAQAGEYDAKRLNVLGRHLFEVIAPDAADAHEAALLAKEEAAAMRATYLTGHDDGTGKVRFKGTLPTAQWAMLTKALRAIAAAKHVNATHGAGTSTSAAARPGPEAMGRALCEYIERYPAEKLPHTGGVNATMMVTIDEASLLGRLEKAGVLDTGHRISPGLARRLACEAGIIPVVLGGKSQPLDLGRKKRLFTEAQRLALAVQQGGECAAEGCDRTQGLHAHHLTPWAKGGTTDLTNGIGLCHWHHMRAHDPTYEMTRGPTGTVTFHRRT